ncbi:NAD-dependent epimerase/dehydratase family protein [Nocardia cyriacigeorgica]|uniref:UDP-sulfoquinovose synthase (Sulfite:UDP-glucose sulfotransferase) (Sulfolipid biosynthesis protein) n=2 Tax=Nocardia cyriacigeorgica TaxID=135487 RepID=H6R3U3_NOCCG|nr:NAD-dependent epimerase/dehydratase family protein [Nocardia cyriacigeorgica]NEW34486.1 NAD-dependent epimerase/dehydratase family protein [Nocardia cyriacigeorgica]BDT86888.1 UDP-sulfoquinovose synthase [Nocardia cyriacigeorgica]CCF63249.1 UDP-sulfoquinovose synthase (Sulfite:UDP-glucose sulfotransferase) (Sulfolipid biosynthesis protein) [Nocardia cyriacigeorgica GUH-2]
MRTLILGGDGFCGWPSALHLSAHGHEVTICDSLVRRHIDDELGVRSLTPIRSLPERVHAWRTATGRDIATVQLDLSRDYQQLTELLAAERPDTIVHFAEQRAAPYSMKSPQHKRYTVDNNVNATHNVLAALVQVGLDAHLVHLGTMGVYGYESVPVDLPEGYLTVSYPDRQGIQHSRDILYPTQPGSVYHLTKSLDQLLFQFYARNDRVRITDLHQGIVWGTQTEETELDPRLINRFDYDGDFGTVLNRFLVEAAIGYPLTVHGTGGQTRAFINIRDTVRCIRLAVESGAEVDGRVRVMNQVTETHRVSDLADLVAGIVGATVHRVSNPRAEADANELSARNDQLLGLGLEPTRLATGLLRESVDIAQKYADRVDVNRIPCTSYWNADRRAGAEEQVHG